MMQKNRKRNNIEELIRNKRYFDVGFNWYFNKYLGSFWQKRLFFYLFFIIFSVASFAFYLNYRTLSRKPIYTKIIAHIDSSDEMAIIKKLENKYNKNPNFLIAYYLIEKYVTIRESYNYSQLEFQKNFLFNNSTSFLYIEYKKLIDLANLSSPIILYGTKNSISVEINNITILLDENKFPYKAEVKFSVFNKTKQNIIGQYVAEMEFFMNNIFFVPANASRFTFTMLRYKTYKIS